MADFFSKYSVSLCLWKTYLIVVQIFSWTHVISSNITDRSYDFLHGLKYEYIFYHQKRVYP